MDEKGLLHDIFTADPLQQKNFAHKFVEILLTNGEVFEGVVYTIDPVSQSVVMVSKNKEDEKMSVKIIMKSSITSMKILPDVPSSHEISFSKIFEVDKVNNVNESQKNVVKHWLEKNLIPVTENNGLLIVDTLEIHPPYGPDQCYSSNSIVLSRIQKLLKEMPPENN